MPLYLADTSAWHRSGQVADRWAQLLDHDELAICEPVALEVLYPARRRADYENLAEELSGVRFLPLDAEAERDARRVQSLLAEKGRHRGAKPIDLLIAAVANVNSAVLLHYDRHFDAVAAVTGQPAEWLARRGSLD